MSEPIHSSPDHESPQQMMGESEGKAKGTSQSPPPFQLQASPGTPPIQRQDREGGHSQSGDQQPAAAPLIPENEMMGQIDETTHPDFVEVESQGSRAHYVRREVAVAWHQMQQAAASAEPAVNLFIVSSTRNFNAQASIWNRKWNRSDFSSHAEGPDRAQAILEYSSMPGTSRHHWGTDIDINSVTVGDWEEDGPYYAAWQWLSANASRFGFAQTYDQRADDGGDRATGYSEERWHWSYMPLSSQYQTDYMANISDDEITGFSGSETAGPLHVRENYVNSISSDAGDLSGSRPSSIGRILVTANNVWTREAPSTERSSQHIGDLQQNQQYEYFQEERIDGDNIFVLTEAGWAARTYRGNVQAEILPATSTNSSQTGTPGTTSTNTRREPPQ